MRCRSCTPLPEEVRRAADLLERRWTVSIICASHEGAVRFNEFLQVLGPVPPATLAAGWPSSRGRACSSGRDRRAPAARPSTGSPAAASASLRWSRCSAKCVNATQ